MEQKKKYTLSYPDSVKLLRESCKKDEAIRSLMQRVSEERKDAILHNVNKILYETAEKKGMSLYTLCFHTVPDFEYNCSGVNDLTATIRLIPVEFDLTHDGGYWKQKYYELKKKMQELIDSRD